MNYAQNYDLFFPFFIKVVVNKSKAYSFLIIGIMHLQKLLLSVVMLRFYFFTAKQGTWVHNFDWGPYNQWYINVFKFDSIAWMKIKFVKEKSNKIFLGMPVDNHLANRKWSCYMGNCDSSVEYNLEVIWNYRLMKQNRSTEGCSKLKRSV